MKEHGICAKCKKSVGCPYADDRIKGCKKFVLEDELELTNEELLRQCTTEQLAEALLNIMANNEFTLYLLHTEKKSMQEMKDAVVEWLKQPHTVKEYNDEND